MPIIPFEQLPDSGRLWIFPLSRSLSDDESVKFLQKIDSFMEEWMSHQMELTAGREWKYNQFLIIGVDESNISVSGCSNDTLFRTVKSIQEEYLIPIPDNPPIYYRDNNGIQSVSREKFKHLILQGLIGENTIVFNNILQTLGDYRKSLWEIPMKDSWHIDAFPIPAIK